MPHGVKVAWYFHIGNVMRFNFANVHVLAKENGMDGGSQTEQVGLMDPRTILQHFDAHKVLRLDGGVEVLIRRKLFQIDGIAKIDQLDAQLMVVG